MEPTFEADSSDFEDFLAANYADFDEDFGISVESEDVASPTAQVSSQGSSSATGTPKRAGSFRYPDEIFMEKDAYEAGHSLLREALESAMEDSIFNMKTPVGIAVKDLTCSVKQQVEGNCDNVFVQKLVKEVWAAIDEIKGKTWTPTRKDAMWRRFQESRNSKELLLAWEKFLRERDLQSPGDASCILFQFVLEKMLEGMMRRLLHTDKPFVPDVTTEALTPDEEEALRYCTGYIPYKLIKHYSKLRQTDTSQDLIKTLKSWATHEDMECESYLAFTTKWMDKQNRGGLFKINDDVFLLFKMMEIRVRKHVKSTEIENLQNVNIKGLLMENLNSDRFVQSKWQKVAKDLSPISSSYLFNDVCKCWIKMRCEAFLKIYSNKLARKGMISQQRAKGLRKQLSRKDAQ